MIRKPPNLNLLRILSAQYFADLNGIPSKSSITVSVSVKPTINLGFNCSFNPLALHAVSLRMPQKLLSRYIQEFLRYSPVSLHHRFIEVFSTAMKLVSSLSDDLPSLLSLLPVPLPYSIYPAFPVSLPNRLLGLICPIHGDLLDHARFTSYGAILEIHVASQSQEFLKISFSHSLSPIQVRQALQETPEVHLCPETIKVELFTNPHSDRV